VEDGIVLLLGDLVEEGGGTMSSAAEFVEGGAQDPCDDACSICLESFCEDEPATVSEYDWCFGVWNFDRFFRDSW